MYTFLRDCVWVLEARALKRSPCSHPAERTLEPGPADALLLLKASSASSRFLKINCFDYSSGTACSPHERTRERSNSWLTDPKLTAEGRLKAALGRLKGDWPTGNHRTSTMHQILDAVLANAELFEKKKICPKPPETPLKH